MTKTRISKKLISLFAVGALIVCMSSQAFAATVTTVEILDPNTPNPNTVYMDYDDTSNWTTNGEHVEKIAWKFFSSKPNHNPDITTTGNCIAKQYVNNDDSNNLAYSYAFDADDIDQSMVLTKNPYYLGIKTETSNDVTNATMGCRSYFPVAMTVTIPSGLDSDEAVTVKYVDGSCDGGVKCKAKSWSEIQGSNNGNPNYLDGFANTFTSYDTDTDAEGYVTFTTYHGGEYTISYQ